MAFSIRTAGLPGCRVIKKKKKKVVQALAFKSLAPESEDGYVSAAGPE